MHRPARRSSVPGLAHQIRAARQQAGLSQTDLAHQLGIRQSSVGQWERGATTPTLGMFRRMVAVLGPWPLLQALLPEDPTPAHTRAD
jgi:transcriptional regulator with XRE-family HTH domain